MIFQQTAGAVLDKHNLYVGDGTEMCSKCAEHYLVHMANRKVNVYAISRTEKCEVCEKIITPRPLVDIRE